jgi:hypothetical protein
MPAERSFAALRTFDDAWIERWASVYTDAHTNRVMRAWRVSFEAFLLAPQEILASIDKPIVITRCGLLPVQRSAQQRIDLENALMELAAQAIEAMEREGARCENGRMVQPMRHHAWPRRAHRRLAA